jgi:acetyl esterase/lipase
MSIQNFKWAIDRWCRPFVAGIVLVLGMSPANAQQNWQSQFGPAALEARQTHASVDLIALGEGMHRVYVFLPAEPAVEGKAPFVFFHHGWQGMNPENYGALIDHLAREGNVVVFPVYQDSDSTSPQIVVDNTAQAEQEALTALNQRGIVPDPQRVVYFGYSMGAAISLKLAATTVSTHLPAPQALVLAAPADAYHVVRGPAAKSIWPALRDLPPTLPIAMVTGEDDKAIGLPTGRKLAGLLCATKSDRRVLLILPGDEHGGKKIGAGHGSPGAPDSRYDIALATPLAKVPKHIAGRSGFEESASLNQLDFFGYWKVLDAVIDSLATEPSTSFRYVPPPVVFRNGTPGQLYLGTWPDGTPYRQAHVEDPCASPAGDAHR